MKLTDENGGEFLEVIFGVTLFMFAMFALGAMAKWVDRL